MNLVTIGKITGTHHLKGAVKSNISIKDVHKIINEKVLIEKLNGEKRILKIIKISKLFGNKVIIEFNEIKDKTEGNLLVNSFIKVNRNILGMNEDEYLLEDLLGMTVITSEKENIGTVSDLFDTAAHDIIVVEDELTETLIPNIENFVKNIDFEKKEIYVKILEGMRENKKIKK